MTAPSHFVEPCGCSSSVHPKRWGPHFSWYAGQFCDKKWINLVIFPSLQVRSLLFFFLWKPVSHSEKSEEREWVNRHREVQRLHRHIFFFSQQGIICSSKYFIFSSACLETWSRQGSDGFCQLQDGLLSCVTSEAECEHNMQVLAVIEVGCALAKEFKLVLTSLPYWFPESFQKNKRFKPLLHRTHHFVLGALLLLVSRFQSPRWGVRDLGIPHSLPFGPSCVAGHPPERSRQSWVCLAAWSTEKTALRSRFLLCLQIRKSFYSHEFLNPKTQFWLSKCQSARHHKDYCCCDFMLMEVCQWWAVNVRLILMRNIDTKSSYVIFLGLVLVSCGNRHCRGSEKGWGIDMLKDWKLLLLASKLKGKTQRIKESLQSLSSGLRQWNNPLTGSFFFSQAPW